VILVLYVSKTSLIWLAITSTYTVHQPISIIFCRTVTEKVNNQMMLHFSPRLKVIIMVALWNRTDHYIFILSFVLLLWSPYGIRQTIYIFMLWFVMVALCNRADHNIFILFLLLSSFFFLFFSLPNLSGRRLDVYHTLAHGVALVRI